VLIALTTLTMVFPNVTISSAGPMFSEAQWIFAAIVSAFMGHSCSSRRFGIGITFCLWVAGPRSMPIPRRTEWRGQALNFFRFHWWGLWGRRKY
jgi:hypothetical protein